MLHGETILIAGGSAGIGLAVALEAHRLGARPVVVSRSAPGRLEALRARGGPDLEAHAFDLADRQGHARLLAAVGPLDHLVVAVRPQITPAPFPEMDLDQAERAFAAKLWDACHLIRAARRHLRADGSVTLTSGIAGERIYPGHTAMAVINGATETLCRALAVELAPLRVNVISPGFVEPKPPQVREKAHGFPLKRLAAPEEVAKAYLAVMANPYQTGTVTVVDGGARLI